MSASPEVVSAVDTLRAAGVLDEARAERFSRVAKGDLMSVRREVRAALWLGVGLLVSGAGLFLKENAERLGPVTVAAVVGLLAVACLVWAYRRAAPFTWARSDSPHAAFDYVLLLGALLAAGDLAWLEAQVKILGPAWPWHLLAVAVFYGALAYRFDSRMLLSLALTSFAAWRGISLAIARGSLGRGDPARLRAEALGTGVLFVVVGAVLARRGRKAHFEDVFVDGGLLLVFGGLLSGVFTRESWPLWLLALLAVSAAVAAAAWMRRTTLPFALAVVAAYLGLLRAIFQAGGGLGGGFMLGGMLGCGAVAAIFVAHRRMRSS